MLESPNARDKQSNNAIMSEVITVKSHNNRHLSNIYLKNDCTNKYFPTFVRFKKGM
ncbi:MAG: hypothetical protein ACJAUH_000952 [Saprospiraceae bacterium]|jgi:hypothetical protein